MPRLGLFIVLLLTTALAFAKGGGVDVTSTDIGVFSIKPREVITRVFQVTNRTGVSGNFEGRLLLPEGWRAVTPDFPFQLAPGATVIRLVSFFAPEHTAAGAYRVGYQVANRDTRAIGGAASLQVQVLPVFKLQVDILELPAVAIVSEPYPAVFQISNYSNTPLTVGFAAESGRGGKPKPAAGTLNLAPGESRPVELMVWPPELTEAAWDEISLTATAPGHGLSDTAKRTVETLPRVSGKETLYHSIRTQFTQRMGANWGNRYSGSGGGPGQGRGRERLQGAMQLEWSGNGALDDSGDRTLNFLLRGPDLNQTTIFGQPSWFLIDYRGKEFDWGLGNLNFVLSPLTEMGAGGFGGRLGWHNDQWRLSAWHTHAWNTKTGWDTDTNWQESGLSISHALRPNWWVGTNFLDLQNPRDGHNQVLSLRQQVQLQSDLSLDLEIAGSRGDRGNGSAYWLNLVKVGAPWHYRLNLLYSSPGYAGEYRDQSRGHLDLGYAPKDNPWSFWGFYHYDQYNQEQLRYRYDYSDRYLYWNQERMVIDPARDQESAGAGVAWRAADSSRYSAELRYGECRNTRSSVTPFNDVTQALRLGFNRTFKDWNLSLDASLDVGRRFDHLTGEAVAAQGYRLSLFWRPSNRLTLGAYVNDSMDRCMNYGQNNPPTLGLSAGLWFNDKSSLSLSVQAQQSAIQQPGARQPNVQNQVMANAQYNYRRDNGDIIGVQAQYASGTYADANLMLSYTIPIDVPTMRRTDVATLRGQVYDQETGKGLANVVLRMDRLVAITDELGNFTFPSVQRARYELTLSGGRLPVGMIPVVAMPVAVDLVTEAEVPVKIPFIRGATIDGVVQLYEPDTSLLPSQTFVKVGQGGAAKSPPAAQELKPTRGLGGLLVEVRNGDEVYRRQTNGNGTFRFAGLKPGTWTVTIDPAALPENATIEETSFTLEVKPSAEEKLEFRVEQRIRSMRMLAPLKVSG